MKHIENELEFNDRVSDEPFVKKRSIIEATYSFTQKQKIGEPANGDKKLRNIFVKNAIENIL